MKNRALIWGLATFCGTLMVSSVLADLPLGNCYECTANTNPCPGSYIYVGDDDYKCCSKDVNSGNWYYSDIKVSVYTQASKPNCYVYVSTTFLTPLTICTPDLGCEATGGN